MRIKRNRRKFGRFGRIFYFAGYSGDESYGHASWHLFREISRKPRFYIISYHVTEIVQLTLSELGGVRMDFGGETSQERGGKGLELC